MPLARIITSTPAQVAGLSEYLRSRGYIVELIEPGTLSHSPAELEMDLEGCTAEEAMSRGVSTVEAQGQGGRQAIAYDITGRPVAFADEEEPPAKGSNVLAQARNGLVSAVREMMENLQLSAGRLREWFAEGRHTMQEHLARHRKERRRTQTEKVRQHEARSLAQEAERSRRQEQEEAQRRAAAARSYREREEAARREQAERVRREQEAARRTALGAAHEREQQEQARREELADRERRIMERYRREARLDVLRERSQLEQTENHSYIAPAEGVLARRESGRARGLNTYHRADEWKKAAAAAVALALLATVGYAAYENRQPAAPLSNRALVRSQNVSQPVPFGAATVAPPQIPAATQSHAPLPQGDVAPAAAAPPAPRLRVRRARHTSSADDAIADDVVVVHRAGTPASRTTATSTGPKRISDLEQ